jgi:hypothetical protein
LGTERNLRPQNDCTLVAVETQYDVQVEGSSFNVSTPSDKREEVRCALSDDDIATVGKYFLSVKGLDEEQMNYIQSGDTTLNIAATMIEDGDIHMPAGAGLELFGSLPQGRRRLASNTGTKKVLVVRATASDVSTTASKARIADDVFGVSGDSNNLKSQYLQCSNNKLRFEPAPSDGIIQDGVIEVNVEIRASGSDRFDLEDVVEIAAANLVGNLGQFDHVMLCLPPGSLSSGSASW